jgi:large subunit ribosomal protein L18e
MKTKTKIDKQIQKKSNKELVETIIAAKKKDKWLKVARILSGPRRKAVSLNLEEINENSKDGETIIVPGKVLSQGEMDKKIKIVALSFSEKAKEKLLKSKILSSSIIEEIKKNPDIKKGRILTTGK